MFFSFLDSRNAEARLYCRTQWLDGCAKYFSLVVNFSERKSKTQVKRYLFSRTEMDFQKFTLLNKQTILQFVTGTGYVEQLLAPFWLWCNFQARCSNK